MVENHLVASQTLHTASGLQFYPRNCAYEATAAGNSNKEISAQLHLSVKTIETCRTRASEKLNLRSRAAIVRVAQSNAWLAATLP